MRKISLLLVVLVILLVGCGSNVGLPGEKIELSKDSAPFILIPDGYELLVVARWENNGGNPMVFLKDKEDERIYQLKEGKIGAEIVIPKGFSLVGSDAVYNSLYGEQHVSYYCRDNKDGKIYLFSSK